MMELYLVILLSLISLDTVITGICPSNCKLTTCNDKDFGCPDCKVAYWGRRCQYPMECLSSSTGVEYRGKRNTTKTGIACQAWSSQTPHEHTSTHFPSNYCRHRGENPNVPWCYTMDKSIRSESCDIEQCSEHCKRPDFDIGYDVVSPPRNGFAPGLVLGLILSCETGYMAPPVSNITCQKSSLKWTAWPKCQRIKCQKPNIDNAVVVPMQDEYLFQDTIQIKCETGYRLAGNSATCQANEKWTFLPSCIVNECPAPAAIPNSSMVGKKAKYVYQDTVAIVCNTGYIRHGQGTMTCQADKTWSSAPTCAKVKCPTPSLKANSKISNPKPEYEYQDQISIKCDIGYTLQGQKALTCRADKSWSSSVPSCKVNKCESPKLNLNSRIISKATFEYRDVVTFVCETGYFTQEPTQLTCLANRTWDRKPPTCKIAECTLPFLPSTMKLQDPKQNYTYGDVLTFSCTEGFEFLGGNTSYCQAPEKWSEPFPLCKKINCIKLKLSANLISNPKKQEYSYMDKISFACEEGYKLSHTNELECQANRLWDKEEPFCMEICNGLSTIHWIGITVSLILVTALVSIFVTVLIMRRFRPRDKTNGSFSTGEITKTNAAFEYNSIDANSKEDDQHVYNLPE